MHIHLEAILMFTREAFDPSHDFESTLCWSRIKPWSHWWKGVIYSLEWLVCHDPHADSVNFLIHTENRKHLIEDAGETAETDWTVLLTYTTPRVKTGYMWKIVEIGSQGLIFGPLNNDFGCAFALFKGLKVKPHCTRWGFSSYVCVLKPLNIRWL